MVKKELRKLKMQERDGLSEEQLQKLSSVITDKIIGLDEYKNADTILTFVSCRSEVRTDNLIEYSLKCGKRVGVPKVEGDIIRFYEIQSLEDLEPGYFGVREPKIYRPQNLENLETGYFGVLEPKIYTHQSEQNTGLGDYKKLFDSNERMINQDAEISTELDPEGAFMIVPGLVFDRKLNRIGYGKGFYDRYFDTNQTKRFTKCGIAFDLQMCEGIDTDPRDVPLDMLVTESGVISR
jgi:5-formyltetrahydrofolate cyclo-ligase